MSLGITANREKNGALLAYVAKNIPGINLRKLLKIIYLIDEKSMQLRGFPITWFDYYAWEKGPVAPEVYRIKNGGFSDYVTCHISEEGKRIVESVLRPEYLVLRQMDMYSPNEMDIIDMAISLFKDKTADELSDITHESGSLWSKVVNGREVSFADGKSNVMIPLASLNDGDSTKCEIYEDAKWNMEFQALLNQKRKASDVSAS
jgi:uncharacterized phage-associated protein